MHAALQGSLHHTNFFTNHLPREEFEAKDDRGCRAIDIAADPYLVRFEIERDETQKSRGREFRESCDAEREQVKRVLDGYSYSNEGSKVREVRFTSDGSRFSQSSAKMAVKSAAARVQVRPASNVQSTAASMPDQSHTSHRPSSEK